MDAGLVFVCAGVVASGYVIAVGVLLVVHAFQK